jgi:hypothetical protein
MRNAPMRAVALACLLVLSLTLLPQGRKADDATASVPSDNHANWAGPNALGTFVRKAVDGRIVCLEASIAQARGIKERDPRLSATLPDPDPLQAQTGLKLILRGTPQLHNFPAAKEAFKRAAARWEALIRTQITLVLDVDFGQTLFGSQFDDKIVSTTDAQALGGNSLYPAIRASLISAADTPAKTALYNSLPAKAAPTDIDSSAGMTASSATLRALGVINQAADPDMESSNFGPPPAIGLNSKFDFDFDPGDGIDPGKLDFESIALHEIGHVLGFVSFVGQQEMDSSVDTELSIWDLFRVRPADINKDFAAAGRVTSSGGEQSFYAGGGPLALSTGRPDGTGGDGSHAAHWKDDKLSGQYIGVMDPTIEPGEHQFITDSDIDVLDAIGYRTRGVTDATIIVPLISGQPQPGGMIAPPLNLGALSHTHYSIAVPPGATRLRIDLNGNQDVDLFARFGQPVVLQGHNPKSDHMSTTDSNSETVVITPSDSPPLRQGTYYMAVANFGPGDAEFTITATVTGGVTGGTGNRAPAVFNIRHHLEGDALRLDYAAIDCDGDFATAQVNLLDEAGRPVGPASNSSINFGNSARVESQLTITGLGAAPAALRAGVILIDRAGNRSAETTVDFSKAQAGGLALLSASFDGSKLKLNVRGLAANLELEINGRPVAPPRKIKANKQGSKLTIKGPAEQLALQRGANRIRIKNVNGWSNIFILNN